MAELIYRLRKHSVENNPALNVLHIKGKETDKFTRYLFDKKRDSFMARRRTADQICQLWVQCEPIFFPF